VYQSCELWRQVGSPLGNPQGECHGSRRTHPWVRITGQHHQNAGRHGVVALAADPGSRLTGLHIAGD
jgi:hypothetical protein